MIINENVGEEGKEEETKVEKIKLIDFGFANYISTLQNEKGISSVIQLKE